jgi:prepilin peptidase CpaA
MSALLKLSSTYRIAVVDFTSLNSFGLQSIQFIILCVLLLAATFTDLKSQRIPNYLTIPGMIIALTLYSIINGFDGFLFSLKGMAVGIGIFLIPYMLGCMGAGDAKLMGAVGAFMGAKGVFGTFLLTAVIGGVYALLIVFIFRAQFKGFFRDLWQRSLIFLATHENLPGTDDGHPRRPKLCYGLAIAFGTVSYMVINYLGYNFI